MWAGHTQITGGYAPPCQHVGPHLAVVATVPVLCLVARALYTVHAVPTQQWFWGLAQFEGPAPALLRQSCAVLCFGFLPYAPCRSTQQLA
jgi:hypothetical protein